MKWKLKQNHKIRILLATVLLMAFALVPVSSDAVTRIDAPANLQWDGCVISWDPVKKVDSYHIVILAVDPILKDRYFGNLEILAKSIDKFVGKGITRLDITKDIKKLAAMMEGQSENLEITVKIQAESCDMTLYDSIWKRFPVLNYDMSYLTQLDAPSNIYWDDYTLRWDPVENAGKYEVQVTLVEASGDGVGWTAQTGSPYYDTFAGLKSMGVKNERVIRVRMRTLTGDTDTYQSSPYAAIEEVPMDVKFFEELRAYELRKPLTAGNTTVRLKPYSFNFNGAEKHPKIRYVKYKGKTLKKGVDYTVSYENNIFPGKNAKVVITGIGKYRENVKKSFTIKPSGLQYDTVNGLPGGSELNDALTFDSK